MNGFEPNAVGNGLAGAAGDPKVGELPNPVTKLGVLPVPKGELVPNPNEGVLACCPKAGVDAGAPKGDDEGVGAAPVLGVPNSPGLLPKILEAPAPKGFCACVWMKAEEDGEEACPNKPEIGC